MVPPEFGLTDVASTRRGKQHARSTCVESCALSPLFVVSAALGPRRFRRGAERLAGYYYYYGIPVIIIMIIISNIIITQPGS